MAALRFSIDIIKMANGLLMMMTLLSGASALPRPLVFTAADAFKGAVLFGAGDGVAQSLERRRARGRAAGVLRGGSTSSTTLLDGGRLAKATALGAINGGLLLPFVYQLAEGLLPGRSLRTVALKTCVSCGVLSTAGNYYNLLARRLLASDAPRGEPLEHRVRRCVRQVHAIFPGVIRDDLKVWPLYDMLCFSLVPPKMRATATAAVSVCWHSYVSMVAHQPLRLDASE